MKKYVKIAIVISIIFNITLVCYIYLKNNDLNNAVSDIAFHAIQHNLVQLEGAIKYQIDMDWNDSYAVTEKLEDVLSGIQITMLTGENIRSLSKEQKNSLQSLLSYLHKYPKDSGYPNKELSDIEKGNFVKLAENLNKAGWGMGNSYSSDWKSFSESVNKLVSMPRL